MHYLETHALNCGAKIDKPFIYTSFFPLPLDKYITFHSDTQGTAKNYDYLQDVINIITPALEKQGIRIVQLGSPKDRNFSGCINLKGATNPNQAAYIIQNSMLHFGSDGFAIHVAAGFDVPLVGFYVNNFAECEKPYFGSPEKQIILTSYDRLETKKPSFANDENPKSINLIKPEEIAAAILKLLGIEHEIPFDSIFFGKKYSNFMIQEVVPNHKTILFNPELLVEIRADKEYDEESFFFQLANYKKAIVILDKPVNLNIIRQCKPNIQMIAFKITETDQKAFIAELEATGIKMVLISDLPAEQVDALKIKYYEFGIINKVDEVSKEKIEELKKDLGKLYYRSAKLTASNGKLYASQAAVLKDVPVHQLDEYQEAIDIPEFWKELEFYTVVKKK